MRIHTSITPHVTNFLITSNILFVKVSVLHKIDLPLSKILHMMEHDTSPRSSVTTRDTEKNMQCLKYGLCSKYGLFTVSLL